MHTLYYSPGACSLSPHIALRESELPFQLVKVDLRKKELEGGGSYLDVNPKGYVPALRLPDDQVLTENAVMIQYIADLVPGKNLAPRPGTFERLRFSELVVFIATELHKGLGPLYQPKANDELKEAVKERLALRFAFLEKSLGGKPFLFGDELTVADGYAFYTLRAYQKTAHVTLLGELAAYYARLVERPSVAAALKAESIAA
jgi:glutathione S-transferase